MNQTVTNKLMTQVEFSKYVSLAKSLMDKGEITKQEAEITMNRIAKKYELSPIYLW